MKPITINHLILGALLAASVSVLASGCSHQSQAEAVDGPGTDPAVKKAFAGNMQAPPAYAAQMQQMQAAEAAAKTSQAQQAATAVAKGKQTPVGQ